jgi:RimJ/RimL family protein N-acetyltransferase
MGAVLVETRNPLVPAAGTTTTVVLADGAQVLMRPLGPEDGDTLRLFHSTLSPESVHARFFCARGSLSDDEVTYFTHVDQNSRVALAAFGGGDLVGVARYDLIPGSHDAEVACVVTDAWQGRGVGTALLTRLVRTARVAGVRQIVADTLTSNRRMLRLLSEIATVRSSTVESGTAHVVLDLQPRPAATLRCLTG